MTAGEIGHRLVFRWRRLRVPQRPGEDGEPRRTRTGWATVGDVGYLDEDGYLYLTDRKTFMIISGGVNIYPQEAENVLVDPPQGDGRRRDRRAQRRRWARRSKAVVQPVTWDDAGPQLEAELLRLLPGAPRRLQMPPVGRLRATSCPGSIPASSTSGCCGIGIGTHQHLRHRMVRHRTRGRTTADRRAPTAGRPPSSCP